MKKILTSVMALGLVSVMSISTFALDKQVTVYKNIYNNELYAGMGAHVAKVFSNGIVVNNQQELKLERVKTKRISVGIFSGYISRLTLEGKEGSLVGTEFDFTGKNVIPKTLNNSRKYYSGEAKIKVMGISHGNKHVDLEINN